MNHIIFILIKLFSDPLCPVDGGIVILEDTNPFQWFKGLNEFCCVVNQENIFCLEFILERDSQQSALKHSLMVTHQAASSSCMVCHLNN